ncbi:MAG TPA: hypothetical protein VKY22_00700 [Bradyrhizobium sp.]|nr:hypothetical protein [Bradyrhizobium sp.]
MMMIRLAIAALVPVVLAGAPSAADARKHKHATHHMSTMRSATHAAPSGYARSSGYVGSTGYAGSSGVSTAPPRTTYGTSGNPIGTVTAPSVGSYYWPSVGVTNAVPTWSNTGPK